MRVHSAVSCSMDTGNIEPAHHFPSAWLNGSDEVHEQSERTSIVHCVSSFCEANAKKSIPFLGYNLRSLPPNGGPGGRSSHKTMQTLVLARDSQLQRGPLHCVSFAGRGQAADRKALGSVVATSGNSWSHSPSLVERLLVVAVMFDDRFPTEVASRPKASGRVSRAPTGGVGRS